MKGSVWSSLPPINASYSNQSKGVILTVASMDSASFFRDKNLGAESPISVSLCFTVHILTERSWVSLLIPSLEKRSAILFSWFTYKILTGVFFQGLIALLAAVDALSHVDGLANSSRQVCK